MLLWTCPLNLLLVRSHQAEIITTKPFIQGRNTVAKERVEPKLNNQHRRKNDAFTFSPRTRLQESKRTRLRGKTRHVPLKIVWIKRKIKHKLEVRLKEALKRRFGTILIECSTVPV